MSNHSGGLGTVGRCATSVAKNGCFNMNCTLVFANGPRC